MPHKKGIIQMGRSLLKKLLIATGAYTGIRYFLRKGLFPQWPPYDHNLQRELIARPDPVRAQTVAMALVSIQRENIDGSLAELGVYQGHTSEIIHNTLPDRRLYLFDTFDGFPERLRASGDNRWQDTSEEFVRARLGDSPNIVIRKGLFPETSHGLEQERFSFVMLDADIYEPTLAGLEFFYPRTVSGGYIFAHDYNNPESNHGVSRALREFLSDKAERCIEIPDPYGSVLFRKI